MDDLLNVGHIVKAHGIRGEICIDFNADSPDLLSGFIYIKGQSTQPVRYNVRHARMHHGRPLLMLEGVADRTAAELLRNHSVLVPQARLPQLREDEVYLGDLPGLQIMVWEKDAAPWLLGSLESAEDIAGQELWSIRTPQGLEVLFPVAEQFVRSIDLDENIAIIDPPPGLLDLYLSAPEKQPGSAVRKEAVAKRRSKSQSDAPAK